MTENLPSPVSNADSAPYWEAARLGRLLIRKCRACGTWHFMPRYLCPHCWSSDLDWVEASGSGTVHSYSVVRRASEEAFAGRAPYVIAMVDLAEGPRMMSNIVGDDAMEVQIGDPVRVCFEERENGARVPQFQRAIDNQMPRSSD
ncbi:Zn-ribbon domain-containing OB-fold protein [Achromobacter aegrifaciens]